MTSQIIIIIAMCFSYYHISGLATTNILRLTNGNTLTILSSTCVCDNCKSKISPFFQFPIISYLLCKGKCRNCGTKIPIFALVLELIVCLGTYLISFLLDFSLLSVFFCFLYYEILRIIIISFKGKRKSSFAKQYLIALLMSVIHFALVAFMALLKTIL